MKSKPFLLKTQQTEFSHAFELGGNIPTTSSLEGLLIFSHETLNLVFVIFHKLLLT